MGHVICGGLDIGGTKIEARLFDAALDTVATHRVPTPRDSADRFVEAVVGQIEWLRAQAGGDLPLGIAMTGVVEPDSGIARTANLPISGVRIIDRLAEYVGRPLPIINDSMALAFSETHGGAAQGARAAIGLILGTGVAAGLCVAGQPAPRPGGIAVEIGHVGMSARAVGRHGLPLWRCGCGREGCIEAYVAGPGLARLAGHAGLGARTVPELAAAAAAGEAAAVALMDQWADLAAECLDALQLTIDPDVVVLGGGLSQMPGVVDRLSAALARTLMPGTPMPQIRLARHGDASGVRGAALLARQAGAGTPPWTA